MIAVHNAYFPLLFNVHQPSVRQVYPSLWAAPEAVDRSLTKLGALIGRYEGKRSIGIAVTEWGALFSLPVFDPLWVDHVKTLGSAVYMARMLQVFISHPRVRLANYFKFVDRSFMGWVGFDATPKVPYWVFRLYAEATGTRRVFASVDSPAYDAPAIGMVLEEWNVPEVTVVATQTPGTGEVFVNFVNRSMETLHNVRINFKGTGLEAAGSKLVGEVRSVSGQEPTAHNGVDIPPEWPMKPEYEPYTTASPGSIRIQTRPWVQGDMVTLPPFSIASVVLQVKGR
jgi:alpha-N-arabinofuranosidase